MNVAVRKCTEYSQVRNALDMAIKDLGGITVKPKQKVLLKINQLFPKSSDHAVTTHPLFVKAVAEIFLEAGAQVSVGDSPAINKLETVAKASGIKEICDDLGLPLVDLKEADEAHVKGKMVKTLALSVKLKDFDMIVNLPKIKTHGLTGLTGAVKNQFGCIAGKMKASYHFRLQDPLNFSAMLLDINDYLDLQLTIMDAVVGMEGNGPGGGEPRQIGAVVAGKDAVAVDTVVAGILGFKPSEVATWKVAQQQKRPAAFAKNIEVLGDKIETIKDFKRAHQGSLLPAWLGGFLKSSLTPRPSCREDMCISCARCAGVCPATAIHYEEGRPVFDYQKCIRCYCCQEICPAKAIYLKKGVLAKIMNWIMRS